MRMKINRERPAAQAAVIGMIGLALCPSFAAQIAQLTEKPQFANAKVEERAVTASLGQDIGAWEKSAQQAQWLGYRGPAGNSDSRTCCGKSGDAWNGGNCGPRRQE